MEFAIDKFVSIANSYISNRVLYFDSLNHKNAFTRGNSNLSLDRTNNEITNTDIVHLQLASKTTS